MLPVGDRNPGLMKTNGKRGAGQRWNGPQGYREISHPDFEDNYDEKDKIFANIMLNITSLSNSQHNNHNRYAFRAHHNNMKVGEEGGGHTRFLVYRKSLKRDFNLLQRKIPLFSKIPKFHSHCKI